MLIDLITGQVTGQLRNDYWQSFLVGISVTSERFKD